MTLEAKGRIRFNPDVKPGEPKYIIEAKQLGVVEAGSGELEQMITELTERVRRAISEEFCVAPSLVEIVGYSMGITFAVDGPVNRTLDDFSVSIGEQKGDDTECTLTFGDHPPIKTDLKRMELATKALAISQQTGIPPEDLIKIAKDRSSTRKKGGAD